LSSPGTRSNYSTLDPRGEDLQGTLQRPASVPFRSLSALPPYSRKPLPYGPKVSICAKGVSRGVHNIAFSLSPDLFRAFDLFFLHILNPKVDRHVPLGCMMMLRGITKGRKAAIKAEMWDESVTHAKSLFV
jgi:hypothetical protein